MVVGHFDGAANDGNCGVGMVINVDSLHSNRLRLDVGRGTNTKSKLLALWGLIYFSIHKNIPGLLVLGDSKVIVDWALGLHNIHIVDLEHWLGWVKDLFGIFSSLTFQHVYCENNLADCIFKRFIYTPSPY